MRARDAARCRAARTCRSSTSTCRVRRRFGSAKYRPHAAPSRCARSSDAAGITARGEAAAMVTCPINKEAVHAAGYVDDIGHQEILARLTGAKWTATMLMTPGLRVVHLSTHKSLIEAARFVTKATIVEKLQLTRDTLARWGMTNPRIAVAALNPHGGEGGLLGREEIEEIAPAVEQRASGTASTCAVRFRPTPYSIARSPVNSIWCSRCITTRATSRSRCTTSRRASPRRSAFRSFARRSITARRSTSPAAASPIHESGGCDSRRDHARRRTLGSRWILIAIAGAHSCIRGNRSDKAGEHNMKAAVFREVNKPMEVEEVQISKPGPREVLVRVACGRRVSLRSALLQRHVSRTSCRSSSATKRPASSSRSVRR